MAGPLSAAGLGAFVWLALGALLPDRDPGSVEHLDAQGQTTSVRFLATGDINLGRVVGQQILQGDTLYPFAHIRDDLAAFDFVFGNLECQLSDQKGETQHPKSNLVFTGPPSGAAALKRGGITHVSTANNHALDYGVGALVETIDNLKREGIVFSGTAAAGGDPFAPAIFHVKDISFALFSCTEIMNIELRSWTSRVANADTARLFPRIRAKRTTVDFILISYHGGGEYLDRPTASTRAFAHGALDAGANLFLGHHPHVPQGIEEVNGKLIVYSLGNFVFSQPFAFWTQRSFALEVMFRKEGSVPRLESYRCLPLIAANQPRLISHDGDRRIVHERIDQLSESFSGRGYVWPN